MAEKVTCPSCSAEIEITEALESQFRTRLKAELEAETRKKDAALQKREAELKQQTEELNAQRKSIEDEVAAKLEAATKKISAEAQLKAREQANLEIEAAQNELTQTKAKLQEAQKLELEARKERAALQQAKEALELEVQRKLDEERGKVRAQAKQEADEEHRLKLAEKEKLIASMNERIEDLKRKAEQGSQQLQGEVLELDLEELLAKHFPLDTISPVPKGVHGGDVKQCVSDRSGIDCGTILWESKRTRAWSDGWLAKLREDQRAAKAHVAIIVSEQLPKDVCTFALIDGVWVTSRACAMSLAHALREGMLQLGASKRAADGQQGKMEFLYSYLSSHQFSQRVTGIVEAFSTLREDLEKEKRSTMRVWAKREKELERALGSTAAMYGDLQGIIGGALPEMKPLALPGDFT
jgi:hypothetical protein